MRGAWPCIHIPESSSEIVTMINQNIYIKQWLHVVSVCREWDATPEAILKKPTHLFIKGRMCLGLCAIIAHLPILVLILRVPGCLHPAQVHHGREQHEAGHAWGNDTH